MGCSGRSLLMTVDVCDTQRHSRERWLDYRIVCSISCGRVRLIVFRYLLR
jgi:hypothetical protein